MTTDNSSNADFLNLSSLGKNNGWRYTLAIVFILSMWQVIGTIPYALVYFLEWSRNVFVNYLAVSFSFIVFFASIWFAIRFIHQRPFLSLINPGLKINWRKALLGFGVWFLISAVSAVVDASIHPGTYQWTFEWPGWLWFSLLAIPLTTIQTSAEELFFRGYLLQGFGRTIRNPWVLSLLSGLVFAVPHFLNPEMGTNFVLLALFYFGFGFFLTMITLRDNSLELALGIHAANNLFAVTIANYSGSALTSISIFTSTGIDPVFNLISLMVGAGLFMLILKLIPSGSLE